MRIHHLNCGADCPFGGALMDGRSRGPLGHLVCHCLLIESEAGLVLVDTGYGLRDVHDPFPRLSRPFASLLNIRLREQETAIRQIEALGFSTSDVRHIILTHLDFDHAGGRARRAGRVPPGQGSPDGGRIERLSHDADELRHPQSLPADAGRRDRKLAHV